MRYLIGNETEDSAVMSLNSVDGSLIDSSDVAQKFNEYFSKIGERLSGKFNDCETFERYLGDERSDISFKLRLIMLHELEAKS